MVGILDGLKNTFYNSNLTKSLTGNNYLGTPYGSDIISEYTVSDGQKRFSTNASLPNLPKPSTMFYVYFSLNPETQKMINKKRQLIEYLATVYAQRDKYLVDKQRSVNTQQQEQKDKSFMNSVSEKMNSAVTAVSSSIDAVKTSINNAKSFVQEGIGNLLGIDTSNDTRTSADYIPDKYLLKQLSFELSKFVKTISKPSINFEVSELNEYNRKRIVYSKVSYGDVKVTFHDVKENPIQQFFFAYLKMINNNFLCKNHTDYMKPILNTRPDTDPNDYGFTIDSNFRLIDKISICEFYMDKLMVYTIENPIITSIDFGQNKMGSWDSNEISISFKYEGITNDLLDVEPYLSEFEDSNDKAYLKAMINAEIRQDMAGFLQMNWKGDGQFGVDTAVSFIKGILDTPSGERWSKTKSQLLDTGRKLGFAEEINFVKKAQDTINNYNNSSDKGKYVFKVSDDPTSIIGQITNSTFSGSSSILNLF